MNKIDSNMSAYLHAYEAYRIPKGTAVKDATGQEHVLSKEEDVLVLTEKSSKQLIEDSRDYGGMLQMKAEVAAQVMAQRMKKEIEKKKSEWDEKEEAEQQKKMDELCEASNEMAVNLGAGVIGTNIDLSL